MSGIFPSRERADKARKRTAWIAPCLLLSGLLTIGQDAALAQDKAEREAEKTSALTGRVSTPARQPVAEARVYAYDVATYVLENVMTDEKGGFRFDRLPAGVFKVVAYKAGFAPAADVLLRQSPSSRQKLDLRLVEEDVGDVRQAESYWDARRRVPPDVLREIERFELAQAAGYEWALSGAELVEARVRAASGVEQVSDLGDVHRVGAEVGVDGTVGKTRLSLDGHFEDLGRADQNRDAQRIDGAVRSVEVGLERPDNRLSLAGSTSEILNRDPEAGPVGMDHYRLSWSGATGDQASTAVSAQLIDEQNYHRGAGTLDPADTPESSRTFQLEGSYERTLGPSTSLRTGVSYSQRRIGTLPTPQVGALPGAEGLAGEGHLVDEEKIGLYGTASSQVHSGVLVEYGIYSTMQQGVLSLMPHSGVVVRLGDDWKARTSIARRFEQEDEPLYPSFHTAFFKDDSSCRKAGDACYEITFEHGDEDGDSLRVGAVHREFAETLRLYFSDDFFNRLESVFVVRGDELPEVNFQMVRRLTPRILARLESNFAKGGGGIFYAADANHYENQVRYLVTSLDTRFQSTATGVFVAFHHLEQSLQPIGEQPDTLGSALEIDRLQVMLTQDLQILRNFSNQWAVHLNMELSRGATPFTLTAGDDFQKKLSGGISVSF